MAARGLFPENAKVYLDRVDLTIDHHPSQEFYARETCLDAGRAACGEIVYDIARRLGPITPEMGRALYVAVSTDCGGFVYSNTDAQTHRVAADLIDSGFDLYPVNRRHFRTKSFKRLRLEGLLAAGLELRDGGVTGPGLSHPGHARPGGGPGGGCGGHRRLRGPGGGGQKRGHPPGAEAGGVEAVPAHRPRRPERQRRVRPPGGRGSRRRRRGHLPRPEPGEARDKVLDAIGQVRHG